MSDKRQQDDAGEGKSPRRREPAFSFVSMGHDSSKDEVRVALLGSFQPGSGNVLEKEFKFWEGAESNLMVPNFQMLLAPLGITLTLGKLGLKMTNAPAGVTLQDRQTNPGETPRHFECRLRMDHDSYLRLAAHFDYNPSSKIPGSRARWETLKRELAATKTKDGTPGASSTGKTP